MYSVFGGLNFIGNHLIDTQYLCKLVLSIADQNTLKKPQIRSVKMKEQNFNWKMLMSETKNICWKVIFWNRQNKCVTITNFLH